MPFSKRQFNSLETEEREKEGMENTGRDRIGSGEPTNGDRWVGGMASLVAFNFEIKIKLFEEVQN